MALSPQVRDKLGRTLVGCLAHPTMGYPHPEDDNDYYALNWPCTGASTLSALAMLSELLRTARGQGAGAFGGTLVHALLDAGVWGWNECSIQRYPVLLAVCTKRPRPRTRTNMGSVCSSLQVDA